MSALRLLVLCLSVVTYTKPASLASGPANARESLCPSGWDYVPYARSCFKLLRGPRSWKNAASSCEELGATLVTIPNLQIDNALQQFLWTNASTFHIGLRCDEASWEWRWVDGGQMKYADWATDVVATVAKPAGKNCAVAMFGSGPSAHTGRQPQAKWHPVTCDGFLAPAVCEIRLDGGVHDASTSLPTSKGNGAGPNAACKDTSGWQCDALKAILCNAAQYVKHVAENCAATCGLC